MAALEELIPVVGVKQACGALNVPRASFYRRKVFDFASTEIPPARPASARALAQTERTAVLACLHEERFQDSSPAAVYATMLDEGHYHCSIRTMYRILEGEGEIRERRDQIVHPVYRKPELLATAPNRLWSWDITKLLGPAKWTYFLPLRDPGRVQPLRGGLDGGRRGERRTGHTADRRYVREAGNPARPTHHSRRQRLVHEVETAGFTHGGSRGYQNP